MSCNLRLKMLDALRAEAQGNIEKAKTNIEIYLHNPVGIGEHPDIVGECEKLLGDISSADGKLETLQQLLSNKNVEETK